MLSSRDTSGCARTARVYDWLRPFFAFTTASCQTLLISEESSNAVREYRQTQLGRLPPGTYFVLTVTLPAPLLAVISILSAALSKSGDWYVSLSVLLNCGSMITLPSPEVA